MARQRYIFDKESQKMVKIEDYVPVEHKTAYIREDSMTPIESQADGKVYDSKSAYYRSLREQGYEIVGNEWSDPSKRERKIDKSSASYQRYRQGIRDSIFKTCKQMGIDI